MGAKMIDQFIYVISTCVKNIVGGLTYGWMDVWTNIWMDRCMDEQTDGWMHGCMDRRMDGWVDGWM